MIYQYIVSSLQGREEILGPSHPDTLRTVNNLALLYIHTDKFQIAYHMLSECLALYHNDQKKVIQPLNDNNSNRSKNSPTTESKSTILPDDKDKTIDIENEFSTNDNDINNSSNNSLMNINIKIIQSNYEYVKNQIILNHLASSSSTTANHNPTSTTTAMMEQSRSLHRHEKDSQMMIGGEETVGDSDDETDSYNTNEEY